VKVRIKGYLTYRKLIGDRSVEIIPGREATLRESLNLLALEEGDAFVSQIYNPKTRSLYQHVALLVNGRSLKQLPDGLDTCLEEGDDIAIFPPIAGGSSS